MVPDITALLSDVRQKINEYVTQYVLEFLTGTLLHFL